jgi:hypothetical protein
LPKLSLEDGRDMPKVRLLGMRDRREKRARDPDAEEGAFHTALDALGRIQHPIEQPEALLGGLRDALTAQRTEHRVTSR